MRGTPPAKENEESLTTPLPSIASETPCTVNRQDLKLGLHKFESIIPYSFPDGLPGSPAYASGSSFGPRVEGIAQRIAKQVKPENGKGNR